MGWLSFLQRKPTEPTRVVQQVDAVDAVQQMRVRARQRLIGAAVLVVAGVVGFPLLFETSPRPLPVNTPIEIAHRDGQPATPVAGRMPHASATGAVPRGVVIHETQADAGLVVEPVPAQAIEAVKPPPVASGAATQTAGRPTERTAERSTDTPLAQLPVVKPPVPAQPHAAEARRAQAALDGKESAPKPAAAEGRFVVQVGAFADAVGAREARQRVEKLGLKTYTQVVQTSAGSRIRVRVGPFASKTEADRAAAKLKSAGLTPATYSL
jgi:DedD protein